MKTIRIVLITLLLITINQALCYSQESFVSSGASIKTASGSVSFSIGQVFHNIIYGHTHTSSHGLQQPYEISTVVSVENDFILEISLFPNPTLDQLTLRIENEFLGNAEYEIFDMLGNSLDCSKIFQSDTNITFDKYPANVYLLKIKIDNKKSKVFKIVKRSL